jgi:hypothetical protein
MAFTNTIFGASAKSNNQPPAANRQFREDVARRGHAVLADGCWLLAVGHCRRKKRFPLRQEGESFLMRRP